MFKAYFYYDLGFKNGLFLSIYQRSLYNEKNLRAKPWWDIKETTYESYLKVKLIKIFIFVI